MYLRTRAPSLYARNCVFSVSSTVPDGSCAHSPPRPVFFRYQLERSRKASLVKNGYLYSCLRSADRNQGPAPLPNPSPEAGEAGHHACELHRQDKLGSTRL